MAYGDCRTAIANVLAAVTAVNPNGGAALTVKKVFENPPATIHATDTPCYVLHGPGPGSMEYMAGAAAVEEAESEMVRLYVHDAEYDQAANIVRNFRAGLLTAFKAVAAGRMEVSGTSHGAIVKIDWDAMAGYEPGLKVVGQEIRIGFLVKAP